MFDKNILMTQSTILDKYICNYEKRHYEKYETPLTFSFLITKNCNLRCKHCFNYGNYDYSNSSQELNFEEYEKLAKNLNPFSSGLFCGGEPFFREDFADIVNLFREECNMPFASTTTNGTLTEKIIKQVEKIVKRDIRKRFVLNFSLDGFLKEHDCIRGRGVYERCIETIRMAKILRSRYSNLQLGIVSTMNTINEYIMVDFFEYVCEEFEPNIITLLKTRQAPRGGNELKNINIENYTNAKRKLENLFLDGKNGNTNSPVGYFPFAYYDLIEKTMRKKHKQFTCFAGIHSAYIDYNGFVNACEVLGDYKCSNEPILMGNLRDYNMNFLELWNSRNANKVRKIINKHICCKDCTHETEGIFPSIYFKPNDLLYKNKMKEFTDAYEKK